MLFKESDILLIKVMYPYRQYPSGYIPIEQSNILQTELIMGCLFNKCEKLVLPCKRMQDRNRFGILSGCRSDISISP